MVTLMSLTLGSQDLNLRPLGTFSFAFGLFLVGFSVGALLFGQWLTAIMCLVGTVVLLDNTFMPKEGSNESTSSSIFLMLIPSFCGFAFAWPACSGNWIQVPAGTSSANGAVVTEGGQTFQCQKPSPTPTPANSTSSSNSTSTSSSSSNSTATGGSVY